MDVKDSKDLETFLDEESRPCVLDVPTDISADPNFSRLGIEFAPFAKGQRTRGARLPEGWTIEKINKMARFIVDDTGAKRAKLVIDGARKAVVHLMPRFSAGLDTTIVDANVRARFCVWDQKKPGDDKVVFEVSYPVPNKARNKHAYNRSVKLHSSKEDCKKWLNQRYPNWEDPVAYWDEELRNEERD